MTELYAYISEYGILPPIPSQFEGFDMYVAAYDAWLRDFSAYMFQKYDSEAANFIVEQAAAQAVQALQQVREEEEARRAAEELALQEEEARRQAESEEAAHQEEAARLEQEALQRAEEEPAAEAAPEAVTGDPFPEDIDRYPIGSYVDPAGNVWSASGELLSPGTTLAMEPAAAEGLVQENQVEPVSDTVFLLAEPIEQLAGADGMTEDLESVYQLLDHPLMTTSFQDYTVTEGLLLLLLLSVFVAACVKLLKEGFSWLR